MPNRPPLTPAQSQELARRAERQATVDYAEASVAMSGLPVSDWQRALNRRYVEGECTIEQLLEAVRAHHGLPPVSPQS